MQLIRQAYRNVGEPDYFRPFLLSLSLIQTLVLFWNIRCQLSSIRVGTDSFKIMICQTSLIKSVQVISQRKKDYETPLATEVNHPDSLPESMNFPLSPVTLVPAENVPLPPFLRRKIVPGNLLEIFDKLYSINMMLCTCHASKVFQSMFFGFILQYAKIHKLQTMSYSRISSLLEEFQ